MNSYVIITPARNEEAYIIHTLNSVAKQSLLPKKWIVVDDGSTDRTFDIVKEFSKDHDWLEIFQKQDRGYFEYYIGVIESFYFGYNKLNGLKWDYIVKLDADLSLGPSYFKTCLDRLNETQNLGIAGGTIYNIINGQSVMDKVPNFHVRGATKIYKYKCFKDIGGISETPGWDTLDVVKANMLGWKTQSFPDLPVYHHRYTGYGDRIFKNMFYMGYSHYFVGYDSLYITLRSIKRLFKKPIFIGSIFTMLGYLYGLLFRKEQYHDKELLYFVKTHQRKRMFFRNTFWR